VLLMVLLPVLALALLLLLVVVVVVGHLQYPPVLYCPSAVLVCTHPL
jgi:hypothetical protein